MIRCLIQFQNNFFPFREFFQRIIQKIIKENFQFELLNKRFVKQETIWD
ncbi:hypothetical protein pb186bvf_001761 [Paramecium bursaria]